MADPGERVGESLLRECKEDIRILRIAPETGRSETQIFVVGSEAVFFCEIWIPSL